MTGAHEHPELATLTADLESLADRVGTLESTPPPPPTGHVTVVAEPGVIEVGDEPGATFDDKLASAVARIAAATNKPTARLPYGAVTWTRTVQEFTGLRIIGAGGGVSVEQPRGGNPYGTIVNFRGTDPTRPMLVYPSGQTFGTFLGHLAISGTASSTIVGSATSSAVAWRAVFRDLGMANMKHAFGTPAQALLLTASTWDGDHNYNNFRGDGMTLSGSDNDLLCSKLLLDSPTSLNSGVGSLLHCKHLEKTTITGLYITCEGTPTGIRVTSAAGRGPVTIIGARVEGRNAGQPSNGPVVKVEGGDVNLIAPWAAYSLAPSIVAVSGGDVIITAPSFGRATAAPATQAAVAVTGGVCRVSDARRSPLVRGATHDGTCRAAA